VTIEVVNQVARQAIETTLLVSGPVLIVSMVVGLLISLFQAITQIQEFTLSFVPKILSVFLCIFVLLPWMARVLIEFTQGMFLSISGLGN